MEYWIILKPEALKSNIPGYIRGRIGKGVSTPEVVEYDITNSYYSTPPVLLP